MPQIPLLHYFKCKNIYSANLEGLFYRLTPGKRKVTGPDGAEQEESILALDYWPGPWTLERTDPALRRREEFSLDEEGRTQAAARLEEIYTAETDRWRSCPSILDCEPWSPAPAAEETEG